MTPYVCCEEGCGVEVCRKMWHCVLGVKEDMVEARCDPMCVCAVKRDVT